MPVASPGFPGFPTVTTAVRNSNDVWAADLRELFQQAHERFGDVCWDAEEDTEGLQGAVRDEQSRVWGHKAIVYARAPKAFKDRYFPPSLNRLPGSSTPIGHSPYSGTALLPSTSSTSLLPPIAYNGANRSQSALSATSDGATLRGSARSHYDPDGTLRLTHGGTPEMFRAQLEWLYTSEGMGDVVEWISDQDEVGLDFLGPSEVFSGNLRDSRGRKGGLDDRREKLGQDLTYMWRSKLYADVQIQLVINELKSPDMPSTPLPGGEEDYESDSSTTSLSSTVVFSSHRFILCSRSPYFASVLLNQSHFKPRALRGPASIASMDVIQLPSPPFTPAALHFCLGYLYNGSLSFSNRSFELVTAFQIHRCATYLQLDNMRDEVEARIVWDFCHGLDYGRCACRRCALRASRVWRFACAPDVGAVKLALLAREWVVKGWGESWGKEIGEIPGGERDALVADVLESLQPLNIISTFRGLQMTRRRVQAASKPAGGPPKWEVHLGNMLEEVERRATDVLMGQFAQVAASHEMLELLDGKTFDVDVLETILDVVQEKAGKAEWCGEGGRIYQALVSSLLLRVNPMTRQTVLMMGSRTRDTVEHTREQVLAHLKRRWMLARDHQAFTDLENWALKEISDEIEVPVDDLVAESAMNAGRKPKPFPGLSSRLRTSASSRIDSTASETASLRSVATSQSRTSLAPSRVSSTSTLRLHSSPPKAKAAAPSIASRTSQASNAVASSSRLRAVTTPTPVSSRPAASSAKGKARASEGAVSSSSKPKTADGLAKHDPVFVSPTFTSDTKGKARAVNPIIRPRAPSVSSTRTGTSTRTTETSAASARTRTLSSTSPRRTTNATAPEASAAAQTTVPKIPAARPATDRVPGLGSNRLTSTPLPRPPSARSLVQPRAAKATLSAPKSPAKSTGPSQPPRRPSSVNSVRSTKSATSIKSTSSRKPIADTSGPPLPPMPKNARTAIATHRSPSTASLTTTVNGLPRQRTISSHNAKAPATATPPTGTKVSAVTAARLRTASLAGSQTKARLSGLSEPGRGPAPSRSKVAAVASQFGGQPAVRTPSGSTDNTEARTPKGIETVLEPPAIIRTSSTESDLADLASGNQQAELKIPAAHHADAYEGSSASTIGPEVASRPAVSRPVAPAPNANPSTKPVPPVTYARTGSTSSVATTNSIRSRYHPAAAFDPPKAETSILPEPKSHKDDGLKPLPANYGISLDIGIPCIVSLRNRRARFKAFARYVGRLEGCRGAWVGVEVDEVSQEKFGLETSDGSRRGTRYFHLSAPNVADVTDPTERLARRRKIDAIGQDLVKTGRSSIKMMGLGPSLLPQPDLHPGQRSPRGSLTRSSSPFGERMSTDPWGQANWLGESQPKGLFVRPSEVVFVEGAE